MIARPENYLIFNGRSTADFNTYISGDGTFSSPERNFETITIPGRNGDYFIDSENYKNITVTYKAFIMEDFSSSISELRNFLSSNFGYHRLEDSYHQDEYRMASFSGKLEPDVVLLQAANFDLEFNCKPQRFLKSGEEPTTLTSNGVLYNPTLFKSLPIIRIYGNGTLSIISDDGSTQTITIENSAHSYINIDCENMECFYEENNCNGLVTFSSLDFPKLSPGEITIELGTGITKTIIWPRWWKL